MCPFEPDLGFYRKVFDLMREGVWVLDSSGVITFANPRMGEILGCSAGEMVGLHFSTFTGDHGFQIQTLINKHKDQEQTEEHELLLLRKEGSRVYVLLNAVSLSDESEIENGIFVTVTDITARRENEQHVRENEERLRLILEGSHDGYWDDQIERNEQTINSRWAEMLGYTLEEISPQGTHWDQLVHPADLQSMLQAYQDHVAGKTDYYVAEFRIRCRDGSWKWILSRGRISSRDEQGRPLRFSGTHTDITDRKQLEQKLQRQASYLSALQEVSLGLLSQFDLDALLLSIVNRATVLVDAPSAYICILDEETQEMVSRINIGESAELQGSRWRKGEPGLISRVWEIKEPLIVDDYTSWEGRSDRSEKVHAAAVYPLLSSDGRVVGILGVAYKQVNKRFRETEVDILNRFAQLASLALENSHLHTALSHELDERRRTEEALRQSEQRFRTIVETIPSMLLLNGPDSEAPFYVSPNCETLTGYTREELENEFIWWVHPDDSSRVSAVLKRVFQHELDTGSLEYKAIRKDGSIWYAFSSWRAIRSKSGAYLGRVFQTMDITERKIIEQQLQTTRDFLDKVVSTVPLGIVVYDLLEQKFVFSNSNKETWAKTFVNFNQPQNQASLLSAVHPDDRQGIAGFMRALPTLKDGEIRSYEFRFLDPQEGDVHWTHQLYTVFERSPGGKVSKVLGIIEDITEQHKIKNDLVESQKLASVGTLAAGIAHEINTPLQVITGSSDILLDKIRRGEVIEEALKRRLEVISASGWRVAEIVRSLQDYARPSAGRMELVDLNELVKRTLLLIEHQLKTWSNIMMSVELASGIPPVVCDRNKIEQVLINLLNNARDAMPNGGKILLRTSYDAEHRRVFLVIKDTGEGISQDLLSKIFDPFFTTKPVGKGTGLGLSIVLGIVHAHGGDINVKSEPGQGTEFSLSLPQDGPSSPELKPGEPGRYGDAA